jgi:DNA-binding transcriptional LysR family regulator
VELRQLRYLEAVARHRHFTRAASELHVAQSALSHQIRRLEAELGAELLARTTRSVELTEAGELAVARARGALAEADALREGIDELRGLVRGSVAIGALRPSGAVDVPALLADFNRRHPGIEIEFREGTVAEMTDALLGGEIDASFALEASPWPGGIASLRLSFEELVVAMSPGHELAGSKPLPIRSLDGRELIAFRRGSAVRRAQDEALERAGTSVRIVLEGSNETLVRALVAQGFGPAVIPRTVAELPGERLAVRPLRPAIRLPVVLIWRERPTRSPAVRAFLDFVAEATGSVKLSA